MRPQSDDPLEAGTAGGKELSQRTVAKKARMSPTSSVGVSIAAKWPPCSTSVRCPGRRPVAQPDPADREVLHSPRRVDAVVGLGRYGELAEEGMFDT